MVFKNLNVHLFVSMCKFYLFIVTIGQDKPGPGLFYTAKHPAI